MLHGLRMVVPYLSSLLHLVGSRLFDLVDPLLSELRNDVVIVFSVFLQLLELGDSAVGLHALHLRRELVAVGRVELVVGHHALGARH